jgi:enoyl reductase-like protein
MYFTVLIIFFVLQQVLVYTPLTKLVGRAPIIIAGMTPTTANEQIVIAFTKAGFHGELAAGGLPRPEIFQNTIRKVCENVSKKQVKKRKKKGRRERKKENAKKIVFTKADLQG